MEQNGHAERIDHRSYERQGIDQIPTVHLGVAPSAMEKRGIRTERGDLNREIEVTNKRLRQLKAHISKLQNWLKEEAENTERFSLPLPTTFKAFCHARHRRENWDIQGKESADRSRANPIHNGERLSQRRDERQDHNPDKDMERRIHQADRREENA